MKLCHKYSDVHKHPASHYELNLVIYFSNAAYCSEGRWIFTYKFVYI